MARHLLWVGALVTVSPTVVVLLPFAFPFLFSGFFLVLAGGEAAYGAARLMGTLLLPPATLGVGIVGAVAVRRRVVRWIALGYHALGVGLLAFAAAGQVEHAAGPGCRTASCSWARLLEPWSWWPRVPGGWATATAFAVVTLIVLGWSLLGRSSPRQGGEPA